MGCDIHFYVEKKINGKWVTADEWEESDGCKDTVCNKEFYNSRNYNLFAILANVRNGSGFAGIKTGEGFNPISRPRGVPESTCKEYQDIVKQWNGDGHSHSYLTVAELLAYDWTQSIYLEGWVGLREYAHYRAEGAHRSWSGGISGPDIKHISVAEMETELLKYNEQMRKYGIPFHNKPLLPEHLGGTFDEGCLYTKIRWSRKYYECAEEFLSTTMPRLWALGKPEDVRIVFFFDN